ncbi:glycosyl hydrolase [Staphylococcus piscifermentans]|uniref:WD40/YVTN/BNR-like repeat-containing protein n=1 Tax=Staphylococcus piscifermentans TaxID=70258 RepID=UPI000BA449FF|nr:glycosyl hydrolase [Staphylococcus piscifermentans]RTX86434.1 glycosyl hydrolase [Staphylococcus piscifermentans]
MIEKGQSELNTFFLGMEDELVIVKETATGYIVETRLEGTHPVDLAQNPTSPEVLYCATYGNGLWKSEDNGDHWKAIGQMNAYHEPTLGKGITSAYMTAVAINPHHPEILYVGTEPSAIYYSEDGGQTFTEFKEVQHLPSQPFWEFPARPYTNHVQDLMPSSKDSQTLNAAIEFGAFINTTDGGETWNDRPFFSPKDIHEMVTHPSKPGKLFAVCGDGLALEGHSFAESDNDGMSWQYSSKGLDKHPYLYSIAINPEDASDLLVGAAQNAFAAHYRDEEKEYPRATIYRRNQDGSWSECAQGLPYAGTYMNQIEADSTHPGAFYALNNHGLFHLIDNQWHQLELSWKDKYLYQHPTFLKILNG